MPLQGKGRTGKEKLCSEGHDDWSYSMRGDTGRVARHCLQCARARRAKATPRFKSSRFMNIGLGFAPTRSEIMAMRNDG